MPGWRWAFSVPAAHARSYLLRLARIPAEPMVLRLGEPACFTLSDASGRPVSPRIPRQDPVSSSSTGSGDPLRGPSPGLGPRYRSRRKGIEWSRGPPDRNEQVIVREGSPDYRSVAIRISRYAPLRLTTARVGPGGVACRARPRRADRGPAVVRWVFLSPNYHVHPTRTTSAGGAALGSCRPRVHPRLSPRDAPGCCAR